MRSAFTLSLGPLRNWGRALGRALLSSGIAGSDRRPRNRGLGHFEQPGRPRRFPATIFSGFTPRSHAEDGLSLSEIMVAIAIAGIMLALAVPAVNRKAMDLTAATEGLVGSVRMARANATSRGAHYRVAIGTTSYTVQRLQDDDGDGAWLPDGAPQVTDLPNGITVSSGAGGVIEFNTRGMLVPDPDGTPAAVLTIRIEDGDRSREVEVWPSGQVQPV